MEEREYVSIMDYIPFPGKESGGEVVAGGAVFAGGGRGAGGFFGIQAIGVDLFPGRHGISF